MIDFALDDVGTWPSALVAAFEAREALLRAYYLEDLKTLDDDDWRPPRRPAYVPMALRPANPHSGARQAFLDDVRAEYFGGIALRGFHCTA